VSESLSARNIYNKIVPLFQADLKDQSDLCGSETIFAGWTDPVEQTIQQLSEYIF